MLVYATPEDYYEFLTGSTTPIEGVDEAEITQLLRRASIVIARKTRLARYTTDDDGYPAPAAVRTAFAEATCAQAIWFDDTGDVSGAGAQWDSVSLIGVQFSKYRSSAGQGGSSTSDPRIAPEALDILVNAGIFSTQVTH